MAINFGPSGLGSVKDAIKNLERYRSFGLKACEISFTYSIYIQNKKEAEQIGEAAKKLGIKLSIHAPYWINLNSEDREKIEKSKQRILKCFEVGTWLNAERVVFHAGFYGKRTKEETYENIKNEILELKKIIKEKEYTPKLAPEIMGKINVFGSIEEIAKIVEETKCEFCIDFAHILARYKDYKFEEVFEKFKKYNELHIHFSGISYGEKGEKNHIKTQEEEFRKLISKLPKNKEITIINESPIPIEDSIMGVRILNELS